MVKAKAQAEQPHILGFVGGEWPKVVYATAGHVVQELVYNQSELDLALANGWRLTEQSETGA